MANEFKVKNGLKFPDNTIQTTAAASVTHTHGNITSAGAIGTTANLPIITTTSGVLIAGSFGTAVNTFCQGNDSRLSDTRNTTNSITFNTTGGAATGITFNGSVARTIDYSTVGAAPSSHVGATGAAHGNVTTSVAGFMSAADKTKLDGVATGATANTGTVTSVALSLPAIFTVSGSPVTTSGTLTATLASQTANYAFIAPDGAAGAPTFRQLQMTDIPGAAYKRSVKAATTANITLSGTQTIDGVVLVVGDRVLVKDQSTASQNGIYIVASGAWTRSLDADVIDELSSSLVPVDQGSINGGKLFDNDLKTSDILGSASIVWNRVFDTGALSITNPLANGTASYGTSELLARQDHVHPISALTIGTGLSGTSYNGSAAVTIAVNYGTTATTACVGNDSRLSDARTPTSHMHGNITNVGAIGTTANLPVITTTSGILTTGTFGTAANTFCQGNDSRLSDARTPTAHTHSVTIGSTSMTTGSTYTSIAGLTALTFTDAVSVKNTLYTGYYNGVESSTYYWRSGSIFRWYIGSTPDAGVSDKMELTSTNLNISTIISAPLGSASAPTYTFTGNTTTGIFSSATDNISFATNGVERLRINSSGGIASSGGSGGLFLATTSGQSVFRLMHDVDLGYSAILTACGTGTLTHNIALIRFNPDDNGPTINLGRSNTTTINSHSIVDIQDTLGTISFDGSDGTSFLQAAKIFAIVSDTPTTGTVTGRLYFATTRPGNSSSSVSMTIDEYSSVCIGGAMKGSNGPILTYTLTTGGTLYTNGTYTGQVLNGGIGGVYATFTLVVSGGAVTTATLTQGGHNFKIGETIAIPALGGTGSGGIITINTVYSGLLMLYDTSPTLRFDCTDTTIAIDQTYGEIAFTSKDATANSSGIMASITAKAVSASGGGYLVFNTANTGLTATEALRINGDNTSLFSGAIRLPVGSASVPTVSFSTDTDTGIYSSGSGNISFTSDGIHRGTLNSAGFTLTGIGYSTYISPATDTCAFLSSIGAYFDATITNNIHFKAAQGFFDSPQYVTNQYGFYVDSSLTSAINNYGFYSDIGAGTGKYNFYSPGTADNRFAGNFSIGFVGTPITQVEIYKANSGAEGASLALTNPTTSGLNSHVSLYFVPNNGGGHDLARAASIKSYQDTAGNFADLRFYTAASNTPAQRMRIDSNGNIGIGMDPLSYRVEVSGAIRATSSLISTDPHGFRSVQGNYGVFFRNDGTNFYLMQTASADQYGNWTTARPFAFNLTTGNVTICGSGSGAYGTTTVGWDLDVTGKISKSGHMSIPSWTTTGCALACNGGTYTDTTSAASAILSNRATSSFATPTYASTNAVTINDASTIYIAAAPSAGTNTTIQRSHALFVPSDSVLFGGQLNVGGAGFVSANNGPILTYTLTNSGSAYTDGTYTGNVVSGSIVGVSATFTFVVAGGIVTTATMTSAGQNFAVNETIAIPALGGTGTGGVVTVNTVQTATISLYKTLPVLRFDSVDLTMAADQSYAEILFTSRDSTANASGIIGKISVAAISSNGGSYISFFTSNSATPQTEALRINGDNVVSVRNDGVFAKTASTGSYNTNPVHGMLLASAYYPSASTGAIIFTIPYGAAGSLMYSIRVQGMLYSSAILDFIVQGYKPTGSSWTQLFKTNYGSTDIQVRFGVNPSGQSCLILGDTTSTWVHTHIGIPSCMITYGALSISALAGWTSSLVTDLTGYTLTSTITASSIVSNVVASSGGSAAANAFTTTGDVNTGIYFPGADLLGFSTGGSERVRIGATGVVAIGTTTTTGGGSGTHIRAGGNVTGAVSSRMIYCTPTIQSDVTTYASIIETSAATAAATFTLTSLTHYNAVQGTFGANSVVTNQYGFLADSTLIGAANNYGFFSNIASGTNRYNFYANGTADNYFKGKTTFYNGIISGNTNGYPDRSLMLDFGSDVAGTWRRIINVSSPSGTYITILFKIDVVDPQANHGISASVDTVQTETYYVACVRTEATTQDSPDACYVRGPTDLIRATKTSTGTYEIHIKNRVQYREYRVNISVITVNGAHTVTYYDGDTATAGTAQYTATVSTGAKDNYQNVNILNSLTVSGGVLFSKTVTPAGTTGAQTINKTIGSVNFAAAATSLVVTNNLVSTSSIVIAIVATNDSTMKSVTAVAAAGSFTLYANAAPTAETRVNFVVCN